MELRAARIAGRAKRQGSGRVSGAMHFRPVCTPSADRGKGTPTLVAQEATFNLDSGRPLGQVNTTLVAHAVKGATPDTTQTVVDMYRCGPALNSGKTPQPQVRTAADERKPV